MSTKPKVATKKRLLESIESLQAELQRAYDNERSERGQRLIAESKIRELENKAQFASASYGALEHEVENLRALHAAEKARADAFELVIRLRYRAEKPSAPADCRAMTDEAIRQQGFDGILRRP